MSTLILKDKHGNEHKFEHGHIYMLGQHANIIKVKVPMPNRESDKKPVIEKTPLAKAIRAMKDNLEKILTVEQIAQKSCLSVRSLQRLFMNRFGITVSKYYMSLRLYKAQEMIRETDAPISRIYKIYGFSAQPHFCACYKKKFGISPKQDRLNKWRKLSAQNM